jgi:hypothetical protein
MAPDADAENESQEPAPQWQAFLQLFRLPNVFTAIADVMMGFLFVRPSLEPLRYSLPLIVASALLYTSGMVLNDVFDLEVDRRERPERPLPSGRIQVGLARWLGFEMLFVGTAFGIAATVMHHDARPAIVAILLAAMIVAYNRFLKATFVGPIAMGSCRFLNVLLGMSAAAGAWTGVNYLIAAGIGIYIVGVSWFARREADEQIHRGPLIAGTILITIGIVLLAWFPYSSLVDQTKILPTLESYPQRWELVWILLGITIFWRCVHAILQPHPLYVQLAIRHCLLSLITFDAVITYAMRDIYWAALVLALVVPMTILSRWSYSS